MCCLCLQIYYFSKIKSSKVEGSGAVSSTWADPLDRSGRQSGEVERLCLVFSCVVLCEYRPDVSRAL